MPHDGTLFAIGRSIYDFVASVLLMIPITYALERVVLLQYLPRRSARLHWSMAALISVALAQQAAELMRATWPEQREVILVVTANQVGWALASASLLTVLDRTILWRRRRAQGTSRTF